jgi:hypothetical protein
LDRSGPRDVIEEAEDYDEAKEGWLVRVYQGHETLEPLHEPL